MQLFQIILIVKCSIEALLAVLVVLLNACVLITLVRKRSLHTPSNTVMGYLCCSDLVIGIISIPPSAILMSLVFESISDNEEIIYTIATKLLATVNGLSSLFIILVNFDRYAAICYPYKYLRYATTKRFTIIAVSSFSIYSILMLTAILVDAYSSSYSEYVAFTSIFIATILTLIYCHWKIFRVTARHRREIACIQCSSSVDQNESQGDANRYRIIVILVVLFLLCKVPSIIYFLLIMIKVFGDGMFLLALFSNITILGNSLLNPILYCYRIRVFRDAIKEVLRCQRQS